jgi:plastocyanin
MSVSRRLGPLAAAAVVMSCSSGATAPAVVNTFGGSETALAVTVDMPGNTYAPNNIDIAAGGTVTFVFPITPHDVRFGGNTSAPADILATMNVTVARTFTVKGTFAFVCTIHDNMSGKVVVH